MSVELVLFYGAMFIVVLIVVLIDTVRKIESLAGRVALLEERIRHLEGLRHVESLKGQEGKP
jgi:hypothetical protein